MSTPLARILEAPKRRSLGNCAAQGDHPCKRHFARVLESRRPILRKVLRMSEKAIPLNTIVERLLSAKQFVTLYDRS
jgi:hypothetical protein